MARRPASSSDPDDLVSLYRFAQTLEPTEFADRAFLWLKRLVDFDRGCAVTSPGEPSWVDAHFFNLPDPRALMMSQAKVRHLDILTPRTIAAPFVVHRQDTEDPEIRGKRFAPLREHLVRFFARYCLCVALPRTGEPTLLFVVLVRGWKGWTRYTDAEVARFQRIAPHFGEAFTINRQLRALRSRPKPEPRTTTGGGAGARGELPAALVDDSGRFLQTTTAFARAFWGTKQADGYLPKHAFDAIRRGRPWALSNKLTVYGHLEPTGEWMLRLRSAGPIDRLSRREREIAGRFAHGATYKTIAADLAIAPATARNHLQKIYAKLGVSDRDGLVALLAKP